MLGLLFRNVATVSGTNCGRDFGAQQLQLHNIKQNKMANINLI
jgi:hypothetical protein